ncbi:MAG: amino acid decarboxylase [Clostridia bacterium]|nr:amino acid decarboxylase [Clostridia bacterium]
MNTPIWDFVRKYSARAPLRLHMPGHKGVSVTGAESLDITEIAGADSLFDAAGIIAESEANASRLFGAHTFYSTEGSSLAIRAMIHLACLHARESGKKPLIAAAPNAHKTFLSAAALLDLEPLWLEGAGETYLSCPVTVEMLQNLFAKHPNVTAVYVTSPDYLGNLIDLAPLAEICHANGALLLCDNAHGAYLKFLSPSLHPMDQGVDLCCDSAHKTLPVLTGGAYLHLNRNLPKSLVDQAKSALSLFASTSPSYLILQSLDLANSSCAEAFPSDLRKTVSRMEDLKETLRRQGFSLVGQEPLKITLAPKAYGYPGTEVENFLRAGEIECEFADPDFVVMMFSPLTAPEACKAVEERLKNLPRQSPVSENPPPCLPHEGILSPRAAMLAPSEEVCVEEAAGRILASPSVGCPPAVPLLVCGQRIVPEDLPRFRYYGVDRVRVVKDA